MRWFWFGAELYLGVAMLVSMWILTFWNDRYSDEEFGVKVAIYGGLTWPRTLGVLAYLIGKEVPGIWRAFWDAFKAGLKKAMESDDNR